MISSLLLSPSASWAAEVLSVRGPTRLQVGDRNRVYGVRLPCVRVSPPQEAAAINLVRQKLPRHSRVNLRPVGTSDGELLARVTVLSGGEDLGHVLVAAGLAEPLELGDSQGACLNARALSSADPSFSPEG
ncbi:hypothetical protein [Cyanobium sp. Morenito 9A2]|uniref:hypothetical protein n=1 Tax=Cyanobium sp. Morenito 9A2 TaxID=2823718 RepID=UPI0020CD403B|nr:hypothetical protein [Cyanobium sp. Morenito 9A2]